MQQPVTAPIGMFRCARRNLTLTRPGCARLFVSANAIETRPKPHEGRFSCLHCSVGASHAGVTVAAAAAARESWSKTCARCRRSGARLVGKTLCVSCFNRHREVVRGRDARGGIPGLSRLLHTETLVVIADGNVRERQQELALDLAEVMVRVAKAAGGEVRFCRSPVHV